MRKGVAGGIGRIYGGISYTASTSLENFKSALKCSVMSVGETLVSFVCEQYKPIVEDAR